MHLLALACPASRADAVAIVSTAVFLLWIRADRDLADVFDCPSPEDVPTLPTTSLVAAAGGSDRRF